MNTKIIILIATIAVILGVVFVIGRRGGSNQSPNVASNEPETQGIVELGPTQSSVASSSVPETAGKPSLDPSIQFTLKDYSDKIVNLADFAGKPLVLNSWAAWCPFCRKELPDFVTAQKEFGDKVVIISINRQESLATAKGYTDKQGTTNGLIFLLDPNDSFYKSIGGFSMPETIFVDKNGNIAEHKRGPMDINEIRQKVQKLISS